MEYRKFSSLHDPSGLTVDADDSSLSPSMGVPPPSPSTLMSASCLWSSGMADSPPQLSTKNTFIEVLDGAFHEKIATYNQRRANTLPAQKDASFLAQLLLKRMEEDRVREASRRSSIQSSMASTVQDVDEVSDEASNKRTSTVATGGVATGQYEATPDAAAGDDTEGYYTTVMLRNIPNKYTSRILLHEIDSRGFQGAYDFLYLPVDSRSNCNLGYAFINFESHATAVDFMEAFSGHRLPAFHSMKVCEVSWAKIQGLEANSSHFSRVHGAVLFFPTHQNPNTPPPAHPMFTPVTTPAGAIAHAGLLAEPTQINNRIKANKLFIGGLSTGTTNAVLYRYFSKYGPLDEAVVITDRKTGLSRGFGFCTFQSGLVPPEIVRHGVEHWIDGKEVGVRVYVDGGINGGMVGGGASYYHQGVPQMPQMYF